MQTVQSAKAEETVKLADMMSKARLVRIVLRKRSAFSAHCTEYTEARIGADRKNGRGSKRVGNGSEYIAAWTIKIAQSGLLFSI